ncbi:maleylpyruvate isomerase family mycothiol-dependent enzyme [Gordonia mangrovi]|uniref:maleylpyruvate isomerase family mycothiol-dependent enzyme n=1 Tax=Gordonia mangrovi TaxID=2665643 RepID=UPI001F207332|nr:maleylpyruvate isomerase family mycothiol-dependent enzyme [Gordonia mangrovi]UVF76680.1 maleylpyruvate isomerase family mycothiol-dependent enzyme [Gordonia mangrovi]
MFLGLTDGLSESKFDSASALPNWTRRHLVAHVAANADALCNLVHWAATGEVTPMYSSAEERAASIEQGATLSGPELNRWAHAAASKLGGMMGGLSESQWSAEVTTAQGRVVRATEIPWMRAREVYVHSVDLRLGAEFAELPEAFLHALSEDVIRKRGEVPDVEADLPQRVAWLTGRPSGLDDAPDLGPWL